MKPRVDRAEGLETSAKGRAEARGVEHERAAEARRDLGEERRSGFRHWFGHAATRTADAVGSPWAFIIAALVVIVWAVTGPMFGFSDTWQLVINTGTTVATFLMVFLIQNTQNRDAKATQLKLDELIRAIKEARNEFIAAEEEDEEVIEAEKKEVEAVKEHERNGAPSPERPSAHQRRR